MNQRRLAALASVAIGAAVGYVYWQLSSDQLEGKYDEEGFLTLAWAFITGGLVAGLLVVASRIVLPEE